VRHLLQQIHRWYAGAPLYHIIRPRPKQMSIVEEALTKLMPSARIIRWDAASNAARADDASENSSESMEDINALLESEPEVPTFILLKNMFYASKTLNDTYVGILHDRASAKDDTNLQSLLGRACGYGKSTKTHIFTTKSTVTNWLEVWEKLCPRTGTYIPDREAKTLDGKMAGLKARDASAGGAALSISSKRATPFTPADVAASAASSSNAAAPSPFDAAAPARRSNQTCDVELEEFPTMEALCARWSVIAPGDRAPRTPNQKDGEFHCSLGGKSKRCSVDEVRAFCVGTRGWGSGITTAEEGEFVKRVYVGYEGDVPTFFLRWTKKE
jgi:hypothetical protein